MYEIGGIFVGSSSLKVRTPAFQAGNAGFKSREDHPRIRLLSLKVRTSASQAGDDGFEPHRSYCGHRIVAVKRTRFALQICGSAYGGSIPLGHTMDGYA